MEQEKEGKDTKQWMPNSENYTIFHALVEVMEKKEEKNSRGHRFLRKLRLCK